MSDDRIEDASGPGGWYMRLRSALKGAPATRADLVELLRDDRWQDVLDDDERTMLLGVVEVSEAQVRDVMIPRSQMVVLEQGAPREEVLQIITESGHSRFPVIGDDRDEVTGILLAKDVLSYYIRTAGQSFDFTDLLRTATFIPESKRLNTLLKEFRVSRNHMAIVVDEYGATSGLLTIEDVLEEIVGEIGDEHDPLEAEPIQELDGGRYAVRALTRIDAFNEHFGVELSDEDYDTVGGLVIHELGRMPRRGERIDFGGFRFRVTLSDRRRVHGLEVTRVAALAADEPDWPR